MLTLDERKRLLEMLTGEAGGWSSKTYSEIAAQLSTEMSKQITERSIRHYARVFKDRDKEGAVKTRKRGNLSGARRARPSKLTEHDGALCNELLMLTGMSASELYAAMKANALIPSIAIGKAAFHLLLKRAGMSPPPPNRSITPTAIKRRHVLDRYELNLHAVCLEVIAGHQYWVVLGAFERRTQFVQFKLLEVQINTGTPAPRRKGRPKAAPADAGRVDIHLDADMATCHFSPELIPGFVDEVCDVLRLPVHQVTCSSAVKSALPIMASDPEPRVYLDGQRGPGYLNCSVGHHLTLGKILAALSQAQTRYNEANAFPQISAARDELLALLKDARTDVAPAFHGARSKAQRDHFRLRAYYEGKVLTFPKLVERKCKKQTVTGCLV